MTYLLTKILQRRKAKRTAVCSYVGIYKLDSQEFMGHLSNRSESGLMVTSTKPFEAQQSYQLALQEQKILYPMEVQCLWARREHTNGFFNAGFKITESAPLPPNNLNQDNLPLQQLID